MTKFLLALLTAGIVLTSCSQPSAERVSSSPAGALLRERQEKDKSLRSDPNSPIAAQERANFHGLSYFDINPSLRFRVKLNRYPSPQSVRIGTNTGEVRTGLRYGYFEFDVDGKACRLQVYRLEDSTSGGDASLFVPFRDATTGHETYTGGRYIDLKENTSGNYDLDFNRAYNPFCAYSKTFSCPVPPAENTLTVAIRAGEKAYTKDHAS